MTTQQKLAKLEQLVETTAAIYKASEVWAKSYRKHAKSFERLLRMEVRTERKMKAYFKELSIRVPGWIDWHAYMQKVSEAKTAATAQVVVKQASNEEIQVLVTLLYSEIVDASLAGVEAAAAAHVSAVLSQDSISSMVNKAAADHAGELAKELTDTTLNRVKESIGVSLANGETVAEATARLSGFIAGPSNVPGMSRAEMIARTESVRAYNSGINDFGLSTGAATKSWEAFPGACPICEGLDGEEVAIGDSFSDGEDAPPDHVNCRCALVLGY